VPAYGITNCLSFSFAAATNELVLTIGAIAVVEVALLLFPAAVPIIAPGTALIVIEALLFAILIPVPGVNVAASKVSLDSQYANVSPTNGQLLIGQVMKIRQQ